MKRDEKASNPKKALRGVSMKRRAAKRASDGAPGLSRVLEAGRGLAAIEDVGEARAVAKALARARGGEGLLERAFQIVADECLDAERAALARRAASGAGAIARLAAARHDVHALLHLASSVRLGLKGERARRVEHLCDRANAFASLLDARTAPRAEAWRETVAARDLPHWLLRGGAQVDEAAWWLRLAARPGAPRLRLVAATFPPPGWQAEAPINGLRKAALHLAVSGKVLRCFVAGVPTRADEVVTLAWLAGDRLEVQAPVAMTREAATRHSLELPEQEALRLLDSPAILVAAGKDRWAVANPYRERRR